MSRFDVITKFKEDEKDEFIEKEPAAAKWFKPWYGSDEFIRMYCA